MVRRRFVFLCSDGRARWRDLQTERSDFTLKIISGGQTGVDRAALDVALKHGVDCGGWCPRGRLDEKGVIPNRYPLRELEAGGFAERTLRNVEDSDGTLIIGFGELRGGNEHTRCCCIKKRRPCEIIDAARISVQSATELIVDFVRAEEIMTLNVAGPRESEWADGYNYAFQALEIFILRLK